MSLLGAGKSSGAGFRWVPKLARRFRCSCSCNVGGRLSTKCREDDSCASVPYIQQAAAQSHITHRPRQLQYLLAASCRQRVPWLHELSAHAEPLRTVCLTLSQQPELPTTLAQYSV
jgi:hypothetical protein